MEITFDINEGRRTLYMTLDDGYALGADLGGEGITDQNIPFLFRAIADATERHLKKTPEQKAAELATANADAKAD